MNNKEWEKSYKKYIKAHEKMIRRWLDHLGSLEEYTLPHLRRQVYSYKQCLKNRELLQEYLSEYYGLIAEAEYFRTKRTEKMIEEIKNVASPS